MTRLSHIVSQGFPALLVAVVVGGMMAPDRFVWVLPHIPLLLGVIMFGMGVTLTGEDLRRIAARPLDVFVGVAAQYGIMALAGWAIASALGLPAAVAAGVILVGTCPGGTASNVITFLARGDVALSVSMTAVSTLLAPVLTPLLTLWLAGERVPVNAEALFYDIVKIVIVPVVLGFVVRMTIGRRAEKAFPAFTMLSIFGILAIVGGLAAHNRDNLLNIGPLVMLAVILHNGFGLALGWLAGTAVGMDETRRRAITIEVGMQNSGLAAGLAARHFSPEAAIPAVLFSVWHNFTGPVLASYWAARTPRDPEQAPRGGED